MGTDHCCLTSAVTCRQLSLHSKVAAGMLLTCLPSSPLFPFLLGRAVEAAGTLHRPEHTDSPWGDAVLLSIGLGMGSAQLLPRWHQFTVGPGHTAKSRCPSIPSRAIFHGVISESCLSAGSGLSGGCCAWGRTESAQTLEGAGACGKGCSPFISKDDLREKIACSLSHLHPCSISAGTGGAALIAPWCWEQ